MGDAQMWAYALTGLLDLLLAAPAEKPGRRLNLAAHHYDGRCFVTISDSQGLLSAEDFQQLEEGQTTSHALLGSEVTCTGLSLRVARLALTLQGASLTVGSDPGKQTVVEISAPGVPKDVLE
jgi:hypothetical protein